MTKPLSQMSASETMLWFDTLLSRGLTIVLIGAAVCAVVMAVS